MPLRAVIGTVWISLMVLACGSASRAGGGAGAATAGDTSTVAGAGRDSSEGGGDAVGGAAGGAPARTVSNCDALGPIDTWEEITPSGLNAGVNAILSVVSDPLTQGTVYAGTDKGGWWRSTDCGATWTKANSGRNAKVIDSGSIWFAKSDPGSASTLYAASLYGTDPSLLKSTNGGTDWDSLFPTGSAVAATVSYNFFQDAGIDLTNSKHLVATFHADCKGDIGPNCLAESNDAGATWRIFKGPTKAWEERAGAIVFDATSFIYHAFEDGVFYTHDSGATWERVADGSNFQLYVASDGFYYLGSIYGLIRSKDGHEWAKVMGAPQADALVGDGTRMFTAFGDDKPQFATAMESDTTTWTTWKTPAKFTHRVSMFGYDSGHHILYSANTVDGLWRVVTH
jgi:hypothetical protein